MWHHRETRFSRQFYYSMPKLCQRLLPSCFAEYQRAFSIPECYLVPSWCHTRAIHEPSDKAHQPQNEYAKRGIEHALQSNHARDMSRPVDAPPRRIVIYYSTWPPHPLLALYHHCHTPPMCRFVPRSEGGSVVTFRRSNKIRISDNEVSEQQTANRADNRHIIKQSG